MLEPQPAALASRYEQDPDLSRGQRFGSSLTGLLGSPSHPVGKPHGWRRQCPVGQSGPIVRGRAPLEESGDLFEIDGFDLAGQLLSGAGVELVPELQQMLLAVRL
jgi:hypothetical protein